MRGLEKVEAELREEVKGVLAKMGVIRVEIREKVSRGRRELR